MEWGSGPHRNWGNRDPGEEITGVKALRQPCLGCVRNSPTANVDTREGKK